VKVPINDIIEATRVRLRANERSAPHSNSGIDAAFSCVCRALGQRANGEIDMTRKNKKLIVALDIAALVGLAREIAMFRSCVALRENGGATGDGAPGRTNPHRDDCEPLKRQDHRL